MAESVDGQLLGEYWKLIGFCGAFAGYNPPNAVLQVGAMTAQQAGGVAAVEAVTTNLAPFKVVTNERQQLYEGVAEYGVRVRNMAKAPGASKEMLADMLTYTRKMRGSRAGDKAVDNPDTPENEAANTHSVSQMSYAALAGHFGNLVELAKNEPLYQSDVAELKTNTLDAFVDSLNAKNAEVFTKYVPLSNARAFRDGFLCKNADSIVDIALLVKAYVAAAFGKNSVLYQQIKGLKFPRPRSLR